MSPLCKHLMISLSVGIVKKGRRVINIGSRVYMGFVKVLMELFSDNMWNTYGLCEDLKHFKVFLWVLMCCRIKDDPE